MPGTVGPIAVNTSAHDADQAAGSAVVLTNNPLLNCEGAGIWNAWLFTGVTIPSASVISQAYMTVRFTSGSLDEPDVTIWGLDSATPAAFGTASNDIGSRAMTSATVDWSNANAGTADVNTSDIKTIIQELVDSYSYSNGTVGLAWKSRANSATKDTSVTSYDGSSSACARLYVVYLAPAVGTVDATLGALTLTSASTIADAGIDGTFASTLGALTNALTGSLSLNGTLAGTLGGLTLATEGDLSLVGALAGALGVLTGTTEGDLSLVGTLEKTLGVLSSATEGDLSLAGTLDITLGALTLTAEGTGLTVSLGTLSATLGGLSFASEGDLSIAGAFENTLDALSITANGTLPLAGLLNTSLGALTSVMDSDLALTGELSATLEGLTLASDSDLSLVGTVSITLGSLTLTAVGTQADPLVSIGQANIALAAIVLIATGSIVLPPGNRTKYEHPTGRTTKVPTASVIAGSGRVYKAKVII